MNLSNRGIVALAAKEGVVVAPYLDTANPPVWTWGVGHTKSDGFDPETMDRAMPRNIRGVVGEALTLFHEDIQRYENDVNRAVKVPLKQHQFDALVSFHYNTGGIFKAKLTKLLNRGDVVGAGRAFMGWQRPASIIPRREAERLLFDTGYYGDLRVPVWGTDGRGHLDRVIDTLGAEDIIRHSPTFTATTTSKISFWAAIEEFITKLFWSRK